MHILYKVLLLLLAVNGTSAFAQTADDPPHTTMSLSTVSPLNFTYSSQEELLQQKVIPKSILLKLKVKQESCIISAQITMNNTTASPFANKFALRLAQTNSPNVNVPASVVPLSSTPAFIFMQPRTYGGVKHYDYYFDLLLDPPTEYGGPSFTSFSIMYTMSLQ